MIDLDDLNLKISLILVILIFMSNLNFMLSRVEHEKSFKTPKTGDKTKILDLILSPMIH